MRWALAVAVGAALTGVGVAVLSPARQRVVHVRVPPVAWQPRRTMPTMRIPRESMRTVVYERRT